MDSRRERIIVYGGREGEGRKRGLAVSRDSPPRIAMDAVVGICSIYRLSGSNESRKHGDGHFAAFACGVGGSSWEIHW